MTRGLAKGASLLLLLLFLQPTAADPRTTPEPDVDPGPIVIDPEERARAADPAAGIRDAVILLEETKRVETSYGESKVWYHLRAKLLSDGGLRLATVEIPNLDEGTKIQNWWGRVFLPSGTAYVLRQDKLDDHVDPATGKRTIRGVLPRAVAGCVIDWGYVVTGARFPPFEVVPLQREWFIDRLVYRWRRIGGSSLLPEIGGYRVQNAAAVASVDRDSQGALLRAARLAPVATGPDARVASLALWALHPLRIDHEDLVVWSKVDDRFWNERAKKIEDDVVRFAGNSKRLEEALHAIPLPQSEDLQQRLRAAYDWIGANVSVHSNRYSGTPAIAVSKTKGRAYKTLTTHAGVEIDRTLAFLSIARALGAEATLVLTTEPRGWKWDHVLLLVEQFSHALVEVRAPGGEAVLVAPGSGLPYGQVPEAVTGGNGLRITRHGAETVAIPPAAGS